MANREALSILMANKEFSPESGGCPQEAAKETSSRKAG